MAKAIGPSGPWHSSSTGLFSSADVGVAVSKPRLACAIGHDEMLFFHIVVAILTNDDLVHAEHLTGDIRPRTRPREGQEGQHEPVLLVASAVLARFALNGRSQDLVATGGQDRLGRGEWAAALGRFLPMSTIGGALLSRENLLVLPDFLDRRRVRVRLAPQGG